MRNRILIVFILSFFATTIVAMANDAVTRFKCGNIPVVFYNSNVVESPFFVITVESPGIVNFHVFPVTSEFFEIRCEKDKTGKGFLLVNHLCGGTACAESNYGLIDLDTGKDVLKPDEGYHGNADKAESILGKQIKPFSCAGKRLQGSSPPNEKGEYCFISPIELY